MKNIPYGKQDISQEDVDAVITALKADFLTQGPTIAEFEKAFAAYVGAKYAVAVSNGTAALHLCALALDVNETSNVITSPITFAASANCIKYCGGKVTFADIDPVSATLDLQKVKTLLESVPKGTYTGIIPVDFAGYAVDLEAFRKLADEYGLWIIEDACHAPGGFFTDSKGQRQRCGNGQFADLSIFSFHPVKHIACGEGGMITTNNKALYDKLMVLRTHGITKDPARMEENHGGWYYEMQELGYNYRLTDFQAALGISQLNKADKGLARRREIAQYYDKAFKGTKVDASVANYKEGHAYHLYVIKTPDRANLYNKLRENQIFAQVHYIPVHTLPYYKSLGHKKGDYPIAEKYYEGCLSIPMYPGLTDQDLDFVIQTVLANA
ncbi:UDP-4-amino-4,6-dideoxy-N-acetyl-beta-L-altrosamine transaminase [Chitinophaga niabensis]|uniref:UDP-4-amino-4,6-dideoxy-N-acetyl-beta-L-altrosamine transaminase n=1 Tax=Chitinophaga niabensis TaxID=536979 RepID=A0A1N6JXQ5_9BACT|nr:UDP-4-amino-4,6-dideoxy-N-acetyl-beta-L-altrosamine transaminase [Chitinophaga niabensis]SIO49155.1 UDP-4-amino-4,6-dideoxy-N-acetyl-beta-L-altrosamine transaminase [Chitinophaga niabensis]